jgi:hypothetical protein
MDSAKIINLFNAPLFFYNQVVIVCNDRKSQYRLIVIGSRYKKIFDKTYKTERGAKLVFAKKFCQNAGKLKKEWSAKYPVESGWIDQLVNLPGPDIQEIAILKNAKAYSFEDAFIICDKLQETYRLIGTYRTGEKVFDHSYQTLPAAKKAFRKNCIPDSIKDREDWGKVSKVKSGWVNERANLP